MVGSRPPLSTLSRSPTEHLRSWEALLPAPEDDGASHSRETRECRAERTILRGNSRYDPAYRLQRLHALNRLTGGFLHSLWAPCCLAQGDENPVRSSDPENERFVPLG